MKKQFKDKSDKSFVLIDVDNPFVFKGKKKKKEEEKKDAMKNAASDNKK